MTPELVQAFNSLTWPGAFALVGCAISVAAVAIAVLRRLL